MRDQDTIAAIATAHGRSAIGVIRVSGPQVQDIINEHLVKLSPRRATLAAFCDTDNLKVDTVVAILYDKPCSYTGEDLLEIQSHGNPIILERILDVLTAKHARQARPGEFTERAFLNNKIDLLQAEATIDLINSTNLVAAASALKSLSGTYSNYIKELKTKIVELRSSIEAIINFPEDETTTFNKTNINKKLELIESDVKQILSTTDKGIKLNANIEVVVVGEPNSGKSTLCNSLLKEEKLIVTEQAGTTRDVVRHDLKCGNNVISLNDTAGIRQTRNKAENIGVSNALKSAADSSLILYVMDINRPEHEKMASSILSMDQFQGKEIWKIYNKIDLISGGSHISNDKGIKKFYISAHTKEGLNFLEEELSELNISYDENLVTARKRHQQKLGEILENLYNAAIYNDKDRIDFMAQELAIAHKKLDEITGGDYSDEVLDSIFSEFCIGK